MRALIAILLGGVVANSVTAQIYSPASGCADGSCRVVAPPPASSSASPAQSPQALQVDDRAIVRIANVRGAGRVFGTGTLIDADGQRGLIITCAHLFREGVGTLSVTFPSRQTFDAQFLKKDEAADLAVLSIGPPGVQPVKIADAFPQRGDPLVSCGYGSDGRLWCNRGQALGYVTTAGGHGSETLELTGAARFGDSGGPVFDRNRQLVAVLFGTNGRVVDGTFCGRIRRFLAGLSPRQRPPSPQISGQPATVNVEPPASQVQPPTPQAAPPPSDLVDKLKADFEAHRQKLQAELKSKDGIIGGLQARVDEVNQQLQALKQKAAQALPKVDLPQAVAGAVNDIADGAGPEQVAQRAGSAWLTALLVGLGLPAGPAGVAAGLIAATAISAAGLLYRRSWQKLLATSPTGSRGPASSTPPATSAAGPVSAEGGPAAGSSAATSAPATVTVEGPAPATQVVTQNHYVPYQDNVLDKAWSDAHARLVQMYPGWAPALQAAQRLRNQLLAGLPTQPAPTLSNTQSSES